MMKRGDVLKLSREGLDWLAGDDIGKRAQLATFRYEYRSKSKKVPDCIVVKRLGTRHYQSYHYSFLELAKTSIISRLGRQTVRGG